MSQTAPFADQQVFAAKAPLAAVLCSAQNTPARQTQPYRFLTPLAYDAQRTRLNAAY